MELEPLVDVFVGNFSLVEPEVYDYWLGGANIHEAAELMHKEKEEMGTLDMYVSFISDQYRLFQMMEKFFHNPTRLCEQWSFQLPIDTQKMLIEKYYEFDSSVVREFLGKKLTSRHRKDLDEVSEKTKIPIRSCRRQFDNVKRMYKTLEECDGDLVLIIKEQFLLSSELARKYASIMYITNNRFETGKRKLQHLNFDDFLHCADEMMTNWSCENPDCKYEETAMEMDREFLQLLRDTKQLLDKEIYDELKMDVYGALKLKLDDNSLADFESNYKLISRTLVNIANGLNHSKEVKDIFIDIVEKLIEPVRHSKWSDKDLENFLLAYNASIQNIEALQNDPPFLHAWERYMTTMTSCVLKMYGI